MATAYLKHYGNARNDDKIIRLRMKYKSAGYGVYFMILERLMAETNYMSVRDYNIIAYDLREDSALIKSVVEDFGLFEFSEDGKFFYSKRLQESMIDLDNQMQAKSKAGRIGMSKRWQNNGSDNQEVNNSVITALKQSNNSVITELQQSNNGVITINKLNKLDKINITPTTSPLIATQPSCGSGGSLICLDYSNYPKVYNEALKNVGMLMGRKDSNTKEMIPILRFLSVAEDVKRKQVFAFIKGYSKTEPLYRMRQDLEAMEQRGDIKPMAVNDWKTCAFINDNLNLYDRKRINEILELNNEGTWETLVDAVAKVRKDKESGKNAISMPGRYIIASISKGS